MSQNVIYTNKIKAKMTFQISLNLKNSD